MTALAPADQAVLAQIAAERRELAALLKELPESSWDAPTLCHGWRVREVVAHVTMPFRISVPKLLVEILRARGKFDAAADRIARQDSAKLSSADLVRSMEDNAENPWKPPGGGYPGALTHEVVHGLDWTVPLGIDRRVPLERLQPVLANMSTPRAQRAVKGDLEGVQLRASDLDWSWGSGEPVTGPGQDLLLVMLGRKLPAGRLQGVSAGRFTTGPGTLEA